MNHRSRGTALEAYIRAEKVRHLHAFGRSQSSIARELGISSSYVSKIIYRQKCPKMPTQWQRKSRANSPKHREDQLRRKYDIGLEEYETLLESQNGVCAICLNKCLTGKSLAVDHDHDTSVIRGLLCSNCNVGIGLLKHNTDFLNRAVEYLGS